MKRVATVLAFLALPAASAAQESDSLRLSDRLEVFHRYLRFAEYLDGGEVTPHWTGDGDTFWYEVPESDGGGYKFVDPATGQISDLFDEARVRAALRDLTGGRAEAQRLVLEQFEFSAGSGEISFAVDDAHYAIDLADYGLRQVPTEAEAGPRPRRIPHFTGLPVYMVEVLSPDGRWFAGVEGGNITLRSPETDSVVRLTNDGSDDRPWGHSVWELGLYWSADSRKLLATRLQPTEQLWAYDLYLLDAEGGAQTKLDFEAPYGQTFLDIEWIPDGSGFLVQRQTFRGKAMELLVVDPDEGSYRTLLRETLTQGYVYSPNEPMYWDFLEDGRRILLRSERDGWQHLYLYDVHDGLVRRLTSGPRPIRDSSLDEANGWVYFELHNVDPDRPWDRQIGRVPLGGGEMQVLTAEPGQHRFTLSPSGHYFVDVHASMKRPLQTDLRRADGSTVLTLAKGSVSRAREDLSWSPPESFVASAADGATELHGTLFKPWDFDPTLRYPVIDFAGTLHGTGGVSLRRDLAARSMHARQALAQLGFIVVSFDDRGQFWRGRDYRLSTWGRGEIDQAADHRAVLEQLAVDRPWMDLERVGVIGHSTGGFRAIRLMLLAPDLYSAGVASAGADFKRAALDAYWHELSDSDAMPFIPNTELVGNLSGRLLMIRGTNDPQGTMDAAMPLIDALVRAGKQYDLVLIPGAGHGMFFPGFPYSEYHWDTAARFFMEQLGGAVRRD